MSKTNSLADSYIRLCGYDPAAFREFREADDIRRQVLGLPRLRLLAGLPRAIGLSARHFPDKSAMRRNARPPIQPSIKKRRARELRERAAVAIRIAHDRGPYAARRARALRALA